MRWLGALDDRTVWAILLALPATALGVALAFEHIGGLKPCPLCYLQRWPYYVLIALSAAALLALQYTEPQSGDSPQLAPGVSGVELDGAALDLARHQRILFYSRLGLVTAFFILIVSAGLGVHHAGVEWKWWPGPDTCAAGGAAADAGGSLIERMQDARVVRCDEAAGRFLGLSFAGYNALFSLELAIFLALHFYFKSSSHFEVADNGAQSEASFRNQ